MYLPEVGYTLVSIGCLNEMSFTTTFSNRKYIIYNGRGTQVVENFKNRNSLYKIVYKAKVNIIKDKLIIDKLHQYLSHIAPATARKLI